MTSFRTSRRSDPELDQLRADALSPAVEGRLTKIRIGVILFASVLFPFVSGGPGSIAWLGYAVLGVGWVHTLFVVARGPQQALDCRRIWSRLGLDVSLVLLWLAATGGADSPWFIALAAELVIAAIRVPPRKLLYSAIVVVLGYVTMVYASGQLATRWLETIARVFYLIVVAASCAMIAQDRLKRLTVRLHAFDLTQEVAQVGSWVWHVHEKRADASRVLRKIFGLPEEGNVPISVVKEMVHGDDRESVSRAYVKALTEGVPFQHDYRIVRPDGEVRWLHCRGQPILDENGEVRQVVGSSQDITESRKMQQRLFLGQKLASLGTLASGIAHEINNPLAYVATNVASARRELTSTPIEARKLRTIDAALGAAEDGCRRVAEIVRGLNSFSRSDDGRLGSVDLARVVDSALAIGSHEIAKRARVVRKYETVRQVVGTESRLLQVVLNLLVNAAQAIGESGWEANEIRIRLTDTEDGRVRLEVSDTGPGIPEENLSRLFDPFFTTKPAGIGTGLGLSICHRIVRDLGGEITVETGAKRGSTFRVVLPAATATASAPDVTRSDPPESAPRRRRSDPPESAPRRRARILVVDDEPNTRTLSGCSSASITT